MKQHRVVVLRHGAPVVAERIPLVDAVRAHQLLARGGHAGKIVLVAGT